jgi:hypothetical protein
MFDKKYELLVADALEWFNRQQSSHAPGISEEEFVKQIVAKAETMSTVPDALTLIKEDDDLFANWPGFVVPRGGDAYRLTTK